MRILRKREYQQTLKVILKFISKDSKNRAINFKNQLDNKINNLDNFPYKFKQSRLHDDVNVRDMTFKGYSIIYFVEEEKDRISVVDIFKWIDKD
ncbi:type II toxin-antitoxin system RelE/ParE family toxin [Sulfurimonas sp. SAG-AH-194-L11]|nr:type II toxin-antitoxin system RelE/ParE family toxin [Sulfurimonas sp. SAG-AH-194-L11]MDF1877043.1 type II toxin-antitoxin system RelE/ParE family toxin [Sulfurimonas sp. SAG-AH-194-L11]